MRRFTSRRLSIIRLSYATRTAWVQLYISARYVTIQWVIQFLLLTYTNSVESAKSSRQSYNKGHLLYLQDVCIHE